MLSSASMGTAKGCNKKSFEAHPLAKNLKTAFLRTEGKVCRNVWGRTRCIRKRPPSDSSKTEAGSWLPSITTSTVNGSPMATSKSGF